MDLDFRPLRDGKTITPILYKRATDVIPPPPGDNLNRLRQRQGGDFRALVAEVEDEKLTGIIKGTSKERRTRCGLIVFNGRAVGGMFSSYNSPGMQGTEQSIKSALLEFDFPDTEIETYPVDEAIILPFSTLFLGCSLEPADEEDPKLYLEAVFNVFRAEKKTSCIVVAFPSIAETCLLFVSGGKFCGMFSVNDQIISSNLDPLYKMLEAHPDAFAEANVFPREQENEPLKLGFALRDFLTAAG